MAENQENQKNQENQSQNSFAICTLGCKVNQEEGVALANVFQEQGWQQVAFHDLAAVYIINTCTVTHLADRKARQMLRRAIKQNPQALIVATGCYAQTNQADLQKISGVDLIVGTNDRAKLFALVQQCLNHKAPKNQPLVAVTPIADNHEFMEIGNLNNDTSRQRAYIKIEDGCSQFCSYCIIPYARGPVRSKAFDVVLAEAKELVAKGYKEIVLTGIHTGAYGTDFAEADFNLAKLAAALGKIADLHRLRLGSVEPQEVTDELIAVVAANPKICPHFHIPLQACDDEVLVAMNRHYTVDFYGKLLAKIRQVLPNAAITTDLIVGFPGERDKAFAAALSKIGEFGFSDMHIFPYSPRQGTPAATFAGQVDAKIKTQRIKALNEVAKNSRLAYQEKQLGKSFEILLEQKEVVGGTTMLTGHSNNYLAFGVLGADLHAGDVVLVVAKSILEDFLLGSV